MKVTVCITNNEKEDSKVNMTKVKEIVTSNGIKVMKASVNKRNGDVYVDFPSNAERDKLLPLLNDVTNPGNVIVDIKQKLPKISIRNVQNYVNEDDFIAKVKAQNPQIREKLESGSEFSIVFSKEKVSNYHQYHQFEPRIEGGDNKQTNQIVIRVSEDIREIIKANNDKLFIGFTAHRVFDRFYMRSCAKCHRFGHYHADCTAKPCCGYCGGEGHVSDQCDIRDKKDETKYKCVNCHDAGKQCEGHSSHWHNCPTYLEQQKKIKMSVPYYSKNSE